MLYFIMATYFYTLNAMLYTIKDEITSFWMKIEKQLNSFSVIVSSKLERDIRTTLSIGDYVTRKISKDTENIFTSGVEELQRLC